MTWNTTETGTRRFTSPEAPGWTLTVYAHQQNRIEVDTGSSSTEVEVDSEGITVFGETSNSYTFSGVRFTIPWVIIREIIRFQESSSEYGTA